MTGTFFCILIWAYSAWIDYKRNQYFTATLDGILVIFHLINLFTGTPVTSINYALAVGKICIIACIQMLDRGE